MINKNKFILIFSLFLVLVSVLIFTFRSDIFRKRSGNDLLDSTDREVKLIITPEYSEYFIEQDIWMKVMVVNNSIESYYLKFPLNRTFTNFKGMYPSGKIIADSITFNPIEKSDSLKLIPGSSYEKVMALNKAAKNFFISDKGDNVETGIYKINARYQQLVSNELSLKVTLPTGADKELYDETYGKLFIQNVSPEEKIYKLEELINRYPSSKYSPQLYYIFFRESNFTNDYNRSSENISDFFKYNNDTYGADLILDIGNYNLEKLSSKYRDSKTGYLIRQRKKEALTHK